MFLALTAIESLWKKNTDILFLGKWCIRNTSNIKNINYKIHKYHWDDQDKVEVDNEYIFNLYKKLIPLLSDKLNKIKNTTYGNRYWEILLGVWYVKHIEFLFDRYTVVNQLKNYKDLEAYITDDFINSKTFTEFYWNSQEDFYNFFIFSFLIKYLKIEIKVLKKIDNIRNSPTSVMDNIHNYEDNKFKIKNTTIIEKINNISYQVLKNKLKNIFFIKEYLIPFYKTTKYIIIKPFSDYFNNYFHNISLPFSYKEKKNLYKKFNQIYNQNPKVLIPPNFSDEINNKIRSQSLLNDTSEYDDFEKLIIETTLKFIPIEYLENYEKNFNFYNKLLPKKVPFISAIRCPLEYSSSSRYISSNLNLKGSIILSCQEGGGMNVRSINKLDEELNFIGCDYFMTWGWKAKNKKSFKSTMTKTFWLNKFKYNSNGHILLIGGSCRRYHWSVYEGQLIKFNDIHINKNLSFLKKIDSSIFSKLIYRFHVQYGVNEIKNFIDELPGLKISLREDESVDFYNLIYNSKLIINTSDYTANLQSLILNIPTLWYWDKNYHTIRKESKKYYDLLEERGILFYDEAKFLKKLNSIVNDPMKWWKSDIIQDARNKFCKNFCNLSESAEEEVFEITKSIENLNN